MILILHLTQQYIVFQLYYKPCWGHFIKNGSHGSRVSCIGTDNFKWPEDVKFHIIRVHIIINSNGSNIKILWMWHCYPCYLFLSQLDCVLCWIYLVFKLFKISKSVALCALSSLKPYKVVRKENLNNQH